MDFRQLKYFLVVSEELSFSRAAERCFISQSAISHQVARLEKELGATLFERSTRAVRLAPAGSRLVPIAQQVLSLETMAYSVARDPRARIRITGNMSFAAQTLDAIAHVRELHPDLDVEFVIKSFAHRMDAVASGDADIALIRGGVDRPGLEPLDLGVEDLLVVMSSRHPLAGQQSVDLNDLAAYPLLLPPRQSQVLIHKVVEGRVPRDRSTRPTGPSAIPSDHTATLDVIHQPARLDPPVFDHRRRISTRRHQLHARIARPLANSRLGSDPQRRTHSTEFADLIQALKDAMNPSFTE